MRQLAGRARTSSWAGMGIILRSFRGPLPPAALPSARRQPGSAGAHPGIGSPHLLATRAHLPAGQAQQLSVPVQSANNPGQRWPRALSSADRCAVGLSRAPAATTRGRPAGPRQRPPAAPAGRLSGSACPPLPRPGLSGPQGASRGGGMGGTWTARASAPLPDHARQNGVR